MYVEGAVLFTILVLEITHFMAAEEAVKKALASMKPVPPGSSPFAAGSESCQYSHLFSLLPSPFQLS